MTNEIGKKRVTFPLATGPDGRVEQGDDLPRTDADAPQFAGGSGPALTQRPTVVTLESMARYVSSLTNDQAHGNRRGIDSTLAQHVTRQGVVGEHPAAVLSPISNAFDPGFLEKWGIVGETFDRDTLQKIMDPDVDSGELLRTFIATPNTSGRSSTQTPENAAQNDRYGVDVQRKVSDVLRRNRFNPDANTPPFISGDPYNAASKMDRHPIGKMQTQFGRYDASGVDERTGVTYEQMKKIGLALMLRATGEFHQGDPNDAGVGAAALLPGGAQLAASRVIKKTSLLASSLDEEQGRPPGVRSGMESDVILDEGFIGFNESYGNLNSFLEPFDGFAPVGMMALGAALVVALNLVIEGISKLFSFAGSNTEKPAWNSIRPMGASFKRSTGALGGFISLNDFGIQETLHNYFDCIDKGVDVFFEFNGTSFVRVLKSPGYYVVLARSVIRSGFQIGRTVAEAISKNPNPIAGAQALLGVVDVIRTSAVIGFTNMVAGLGDRILSLEDDGLIASDALGYGSKVNPLKLSFIDQEVDNAFTHVRKNRKSGTTALAWQTSATPSMYLLPNSVMTAAGFLSKGKTSLGQLYAIKDAEIVAGDGEASATERLVRSSVSRISADDVKLIEDHLEGEYVPFYFHDLRTNEIVSFHAFLRAISDSYTANYEKGKYYGRVDPVMTYTDTDRSINITFDVVSTGPDDFDVAWWKINKLVTLLYPQWSRGRKLEVEGDAFVQPFSQIPTSSPVIRLRLGDIFKSNYSKFALARLFGLGTEEFKLAGSIAKVDQERDAALNDAKIAIATRMRTDPKGSELGSVGYTVDEKALLAKCESRSAPLQPSRGAVIGDKTVIKNTPVDYEVKIESVVGSNTGITSYNIVITDASLPSTWFAGPYKVEFSELEVDPLFVASLASKKVGASEEEPAEDVALESFFAPENNVIVRSFESVKGRGLAGVITSMGFDWKTPTWEIDIGKRAPQYCTITMAFQPIHDIAPGLDADGFNRAPVYNVGDIMNEICSDPHGEIDTAKALHEKNATASGRNNIKR